MTRQRAMSLLMYSIFYVLVSGWGYSCILTSQAAPVVWPASGLALFGAITFGVWIVPIQALLCFLMLNELAPNLVGLNFLLTLSQAAEILIGFMLFSRIQRLPVMVKLKGISYLRLLCVLVTSLVGAGLGAIFIQALPYDHFKLPTENWLSWWASDALGILVIAPASFLTRRFKRLYLKPNEYLELLISLVALASLCYWIYSKHDFGWLYLIYPFLLWVSLRYNLPGVIVANFILAAMTHWTIFMNPVVPIRLVELGDLAAVQLFLGITIATFLFVGAVAYERVHAIEALEHSYGTLEKRVQERTLELEKVNHAMQRGQKKLRFALDAAKMTMFAWQFEPRDVCKNVQVGFSEALEPILNSIHPEDREGFRGRFFESYFQGKSYRSEHRITDDSGDLRWVHDEGQWLKDDTGEIVELFGISADITERKKIEGQLARAKEAAEIANHTKSVFLANMSHEIRTPLGAIIGFAKLLKRPGLMQKESEDFLSRIIRNGEQLTTLINDILDLAKVESAKVEVERVPLSLHELLNDIHDLFHLKASERGLKFSILTEDYLPTTITSDPLRLKQILINLVGNAIKFTDQGEVTLSVRAFRRELSDASSRIICEFLVEDTGVGIAEDQADKLFKPFSQIHVSMAKHSGGTGLGLALSKMLAQALGGDVELCHSKPGQGASFRAWVEGGIWEQLNLKPLERHVDRQVSAEGEDTERDLSLKDISVLVVDDAPDNRLLVRCILENSDASVIEACSGREALDVLEARNVDLVLMDIQMPDLDGYQTFAHMRGKGLKQPAIALTAQAMKGEREACLAAGFQDYLSKPVDHVRLIQLVAYWQKQPRLPEPFWSAES